MTLDDDVRRSTLTRFMPASLALMLPGIIGGGASFDPVFYSLVLVNVIGLGAGYASAVEIGKRFTRSRRKLTGFRAVLTGLVSPILLGYGYGFFVRGTEALPGLFLAAATTAVGAGACLGASMFLRRRRPELPEPLRELRGESLEQWFARVQEEADKQPLYRSLIWA